MTIQVLFFASLRERIGHSSLSVDSSQAGESVATLIRALPSSVQEAINDGATKMAVNQTMASPSSAIRDGDEVAFFPPVTGG